ncbi:Uncharacterised protein [Mycobacteroides abscessus subsp. abscessus]|uniref:phage tail fiber protein n=1 Tax=Mycobacteroides abscessus TaxID=36809 RepID=UPI00092800BA|nr:hypothetical protein [Mycobacteroides abscessus]SIC56729.1 Uncharacterised protein [Mycobacteroides abscessus subsp. abscessus]SKU57509.1 Uncharacterised protein [Mycobacteroides abscessus subsp. abscessus]
MADGISSYLANALLNLAFRNVAWTPPTTVYVQAHTGAPGAAGTLNVASTSTGRVAITFGAASSGSVTASNTPQFTLSGGSAQTITDISLWDATTGGNFLYSEQATTSKGGNAGDIIQVSSNVLSLGTIAS